MKINDRIYYLDGKHKFHDNCEKFFDFSVKTRHYVFVRDGVELRNGKPYKVSYVQENPQKRKSYYLSIFGKVFLSLLVLPLIIYGLGLLINRSKHHYSLLPKKEVSTKALTVSQPPPAHQISQDFEKLDPSTQKFMKSDGFIPEGERDQVCHVTMGEMQSTLETRKRAYEVFKKRKDAFSPEVLRELEIHNPALIQTLRAKRIGHAFNMKGSVTIDSKAVELVGFSEVYAIPMLYTSLERFFQLYGEEFDAIFNAEDFQSILKNFGETLFFRDIEIASEEIVQKVNTNNNTITPFATGWDWHITYGAFINDIVVYINRGEGTNVSGITMYTKPERFEIGEGFLWSLLNRYELDLNDQIKEGDFSSKYNFGWLHTRQMKWQVVGNCGYANAKGLILFLMAAHLMIKENKDLKNKVEWDLAFTKLAPIFAHFNSFDRAELLRDFLIDLKKPEVTQNVQQLSELLRNKRNQKGYLIRVPLPGDQALVQEIVDNFRD